MKELTWWDNSNCVVCADAQQMPISTDDVEGAAGNGDCEVKVVVGVRLDNRSRKGLVLNNYRDDREVFNPLS